MNITLQEAFVHNFLGQSPGWYKKAIIAFLIINPILFHTVGPFITGWVLIIEFIFTLAMALKCYPLQPGGLLAIEAVVIGMTSAETVKQEVFQNFPVILLLMFMVAAIYFMQDLLLFAFTKLLLNVRSKAVLSFLFCLSAAVLSAFLDALTVTAVVISVSVGFYSVYHKVASGKHFNHEHDHSDDNQVHDLHREDLVNYRSFLRSLMMHAAVGTALGGVCTTVGEPQNLLIAGIMGWDFIEFFIIMSPITIPVLGAGLITCVLLEKLKWFGYGEELKDNIREILTAYDKEQTAKRTNKDVAVLIIQALSAIVLAFSLAFHVAEVGLVGLAIIVLQTAFNGVTEEHKLGHAFEEALPFTSLLVVFFAIVAVIHDQHLFSPIIAAVLSLDIAIQSSTFFLANGLLSAISDNVFVATIYITEVERAFLAGEITREHFENLAVAINTGTNLPSVATPNGQAAFLFLLTSSLAPIIRLSYGKMVIMAFPYTIVLTIVGLICVNAYL